MKFEQSFFEGNRRELLKRAQSKLIVIPAHQLMQRNCDNNYAFRQESNFWYLSGINDPDGVLVISQDKTYLIVPKQDWVTDAFDGAIDSSELTKVSGIDEILFEREGWQKLTAQLKKYKQVGVLMPMDLRRYRMAANPTRKAVIDKIRRRAPGTELEDVRLILSQMRMIKQPVEIDAIQQATDITIQAVKDVFKGDWFNRYKAENEVEADITSGFRKKGATGHGFTPIVASGKNTCTIHHVENNDKLVKGEILLFDIAAEVSNYTSDLARTLPIGLKFTKRQQEVYDKVIEVYDYAKSLLNVGQDYMDYEKKVETFMGKKLLELGVITKPTRKNIRAHFPHRTSHMLGLDPHDPADYSQKLQAGMVLTIEPGIYIPDENIGMRIEDDALITKSGPKILSSDLPLRLG